MGRQRDPAPDWRREADEEWLAAHSSDTFGGLRRGLARVGLGGTLGEAVSMADTGPFAGAPRNPKLKPESKDYSTVRPAEQRYGHTVVQVDRGPCRRCGAEPAAAERVTCVREDGGRVVVGTVRLCQACGGRPGRPGPAGSATGLAMPATRRARERARRVVL
jgi:hypothetical protein